GKSREAIERGEVALLTCAFDLGAGISGINAKRLLKQMVLSAGRVRQKFCDALFGEDICIFVDDFLVGLILASIFWQIAMRDSIPKSVNSLYRAPYVRWYFFNLSNQSHFV